MPRHHSVKVMFTKGGFYLGEGPIFASEDRQKPRQLLNTIIGEHVTDGRMGAARDALSAATIKAFELAIELKDLFIALRGHRSYFETLVPRWNQQIHGEVSTDDLMLFMSFWVKARRNFRGPSNNRSRQTDVVDQWIQIVNHMESLPPLSTATVVVAGQPNTIAGVTAEMQGVAFGAPATTNARFSEPWPPAHFQGSDKTYLLDPQVRYKLQGVSTTFSGDSGPPDLPTKRTVLVDTKMFVAYWALRTSKPEKRWSLDILPIGPFWTAKDKEVWSNVPGDCNGNLSTLEGFLKRTKAAFDEGKSTMIGLMTPWLGSVEQIQAAASAADIANNPTKIWFEKCPRQGIAIAFHKITVNDQQKVECILYDPTMICPRLRAETWVKGALVHLFAFRQRLKDEIQKTTQGQVVRTWIGGKMTDLAGQPDSVEMSAAFIRSVVSADSADPFDMTEEAWLRHGFSEMQ